MELNKIFKIITQDKKSMTELEIVIALQKFTKVEFSRAVTGYKMMREQGIINDLVDRNSIGQIDWLITQENIMMLIDKFDGQVNHVKTPDRFKPNKKSSQYYENEIIPVTKMTRVEILRWLSAKY